MEKKADLEEIKKLLGESRDVPEDLAKMLADLQDGLNSLHASKEKVSVKENQHGRDCIYLTLFVQAGVIQILLSFITGGGQFAGSGTKTQTIHLFFFF